MADLTKLMRDTPKSIQSVEGWGDQADKKDFRNICVKELKAWFTEVIPKLSKPSQKIIKEHFGNDSLWQ